MARAFNVIDNRHLQRILEVAEKKWKKNNSEVKRIDKVKVIFENVYLLSKKKFPTRKW